MYADLLNSMPQFAGFGKVARPFSLSQFLVLSPLSLFLFLLLLLSLSLFFSAP